MIYLDALNIDTGGGLVLLSYLEQELTAGGCDYRMLVRKRGVAEDEERAILGEPTALGRYRIYRKAVRDEVPGAVVFCFGNFPPPYSLRCKVITYFHRPALANMNLERATRFQKIKYSLKKMYLSSLLGNTDIIQFQSQVIADAFTLAYPGFAAEVQIVPFFRFKHYEGLALRVEEGAKEEVFIFVSNDAPHKNHRCLLLAWGELLKKGLTPRLQLTIPDNSPFLPLLNELVARGARIENLGIIPHEEVLEHTLRARYVVFPSLAETLGLGLVEAVFCGCTILAAELPYTYQVLNPPYTFDPTLAESIADCVQRALSDPTPPPAEMIMKNKIGTLLAELQHKT
jgi:glycosyltransferase involved in cell wall biosynthesis